MSRFLFVMLVFTVNSLLMSGLWGQEPNPPLVPESVLAPGQVVSGQTVFAEEPAVAQVVRVRDPFWPVGYTPKIVNKTGEAKAGGSSAQAIAAVMLEHSRTPQWDEAKRKLDIRGISLIGRDKASGQPKFLAMVAGRLVEEGNVVSVTYEDRVYRWKIVGIGKGGVSFQKLDVRQE
ncbi:MAG: hypothetical protein WCL49_04530 [bacterium]